MNDQVLMTHDRDNLEYTTRKINTMGYEEWGIKSITRRQNLCAF